MCKTNTIVCEQPVGRLRAGCTFRAMDSVLAWMALLARSGKGARWVRREVSRAGSPVADVNAVWRAIAEGLQSRQTGSAQGELVAFPEGCREVWDALNNARPTTWDQLRKTCEGRTVDLERQLFTLEMLGWIRRLPGRAFLRS